MVSRQSLYFITLLHKLEVNGSKRMQHRINLTVFHTVNTRMGGGGGGQHTPILAIEECAALTGKIFELFWTEMVYGF